jgi:hypothetical protein
MPRAPFTLKLHYKRNTWRGVTEDVDVHILMIAAAAPCWNKVSNFPTEFLS